MVSRDHSGISGAGLRAEDLRVEVIHEYFL
jgi:hypothetical protein